MKVRRVVTGRGQDGTSTFTEDELLDVPVLPGMGDVLTAWSTDKPASYPGDGYSDPRAAGFFPPLGGARFLICRQPPEGIADNDAPSHVAHADVMAVMEADSPGTHASETTDYIVILSGETTLELDGGRSVVLKAGDTVVQNGARHRWRNHSDAPMVMAIVMVGAERSE